MFCLILQKLLYLSGKVIKITSLSINILKDLKSNFKVHRLCLFKIAIVPGSTALYLTDLKRIGVAILNILTERI